jgi:hypothetical protein
MNGHAVCRGEHGGGGRGDRHRVGSSHLRPAPAEPGFALVVVVLLLGFLVLLVTTLATLAAHGTESAALAVKVAQARQHALLGLDAALGQLQLQAGPDQRVTALAPGNGLVTGVWDAATAGTQPRTWLLSGNEHGMPLAVTPETLGADVIELVGQGTAGVARRVLAPRQAVSLAEPDGEKMLGHYAWWVGDEGVKAPVGQPDRSPRVNYPPFGRQDSRLRLVQAAGLGPRADEFESAAAANAVGLANATTTPQLAWARRSDGAPVGAETVRGNFAAWSHDNLAVLADTADGGLRRDLSLRPSLLGAAFAAWADYPAYLEDPAKPSAPLPTPTASAGATLRRRHRMTAPVSDAGIVHSVAPVLSYFLLSCNVRTNQSVTGSVRPLEVRARGMVSLWNPYTSALVPEDLELEVDGLPGAVEVVNDSSGGAVAATLSLAAALGGPLHLALPWLPAGRDDQQSWLPGRTYTWATREDLTRASPPAAGFACEFYTRNLSAAAGQGIVRSLAGTALANSASMHLRVSVPSQLTVRLLRRDGPGGSELLAEWVSPEFAAFATTPGAASASTYQFSYFFRLAESVDTLAAPEIWLTTPGRDPRGFPLPSAGFVPGANGNRPELYPNFVTASFPDRLLDRALPATAGSVTGQSYNEDVPLFELPRGPLLSVGALQHLQLAGERPFALGNSWGAAGGWNRWFDRYFFSGLADGVTPAVGAPLPNQRLQRVPSEAGAEPDLATLRAAAVDGYSSRHLLQGGVFNLNSRSATAWTAVLRSGRFPAPLAFSYLAATATTGTAAGDVTRTLPESFAAFFRFPGSAEETRQADNPTAASTYAASTTVPPAAPNVASAANTQLFRRGIRALAEDDVTRLAEAIVAGEERRLAAAGPFRSVAEFLAPSGLFADSLGKPRNLLEEAIAAAGLNVGVGEFSSQWLTSADLMTVLAPGLFARSDTFLIRTYGDAVNAVTGEVEARTWAEAMVQRLPAWLDPTQAEETPLAALNETNARLGRRFRVIAFRWLGAEEI